MVAWEGTNNGLFTVRSAYHLAVERFEKDEASCSNTQGVQLLWKTIWDINVLRVAKLFLWKVCNILPIRENLFRRKIVSDPLCPTCGKEPETICHILWSCPSAFYRLVPLRKTCGQMQWKATKVLK